MALRRFGDHVSDALLVPLRNTEHSRDFHKPTTVRALARFDRDLELIRNRRTGSFEVHRRVDRWRQLWIEDFGWLSFKDDMLIYVCDWNAGIESFDDPTLLLRVLEDNDIVRHPEIKDTRLAEYKVDIQRRAIADKVKAEYGHAFRDNRRLLMKAWEPLVNSPRLVR